MNELPTLERLRTAYLERTMRPRQFIEALLPRIEAADPSIWIHRIGNEQLIEWTNALESRAIEDLPLYGIPFAIKDNIDLANVPTTAACPEFAYTPERSAFVVEQLIAAGAIPIGKTNLDQFATGLVGVRSPYGTPPNAFNSDYIPGGSSSGSAVAVALGLVSFALGTDTAGSGRVPAAFNNLVGLKPTRGLLSCRGVVPACRTLDCVSIFSLNANDAQTVWNVACAYDAADAYARKLGTDSTSASTYRRARCAVPKAENLRFFGDALAEKAYTQTLNSLESAGIDCFAYDFSAFFETAQLLYSGPWVAERLIATESIRTRHPNAFHPITRTIVETGSQYSAADTFSAQYELARLKRETETLWSKCDFALMPTTGTVYTQAAVEADPIATNTRLGTYTNFMNLLDLAACAVPGYFRSDGLPAGITLFAPANSDETILYWADQIHRQTAVGQGASREPISEDIEPIAPVKRDRMELFVCGAHMSGLALNPQLTERGGVKVRNVLTAPQYRMFALPPVGKLPARPALVTDPTNGAALPAEVWSLPQSCIGSLLSLILPPLGLGTVALSDGTTVKGFICEHAPLSGATDITDQGGWRGYLNYV
jgi:allophanate hydrolase